MTILPILFIAGLAQAVFLIGGLSLLRVHNARARWLLVALLAIFSVLLAEICWDAVGPSPGLGLGLAIELPLGPLLYFFLRALFDPAPPTLRRMAPHAIPFLAAAVLLLWLHIAFPERGVSLSHPDMRAIVAGIVLAKIVIFFIYAAATLRLSPPGEARARRRQALTRLKTFLAVMIAAYALQAASFVAFLLRLPLMPDSDLIGGVLLTVTLYAFGYFCFFNRDIFDLRDSYRDSPLTGDEAEDIRASARAWLSASRAYRDQELDLRALAQAIRVGPGRLSQALNADGGSGFAGLINACRLQAYQQARADPANRGRTVLELAFDAGFNSKATFYRALRADENTLAAE